MQSQSAGTRLNSVVTQVIEDKDFFKKFTQRIMSNVDMYTAPFNVLPLWLSNLLGGRVYSADWIASHVLPVGIITAVAATIAWNRTDKEASEEMKLRRFANLQLVLTGLSVSFALFTLGKMQYSVRGFADRLVITTGALLESMLTPDGRVTDSNTQIIQGRLLHRLPRSVQARLAAGVVDHASSPAVHTALPADVGTV